jgi:RNA polymerase sigma factor (TIGR02999 family)
MRSPQDRADVSSDDSTSAATIAGLIAAADRGDPASAEALFTTLYQELHRLARRQLRVGSSNATLGATTLLHECYLDMSGRAAAFPDRNRFVAYAAHAMRGLIVDYIRERRALKRGGEYHLTSLSDEVAESVADVDDTVRLSEALDDLSQVDAALAELVELKFFCGFSFAEIAAMRGVSERTVQRDWQKARMLLHSELTAK